MAETKFVIQAFTSQQFKEIVVKWLNAQAMIHRSNARIARTMRWEKENNDKADTLEYAAKFIYEIVIEEPKPMTEEELFAGLDSNRRCDEV